MTESLVGRKVVCVRMREKEEYFYTLGKSYTIYDEAGDFIFFKGNNGKQCCYVAMYIDNIVLGDFMFEETYNKLNQK